MVRVVVPRDDANQPVEVLLSLIGDVQCIGAAESGRVDEIAKEVANLVSQHLILVDHGG